MNKEEGEMSKLFFRLKTQLINLRMYYKIFTRDEIIRKDFLEKASHITPWYCISRRDVLKFNLLLDTALVI